MRFFVIFVLLVRQTLAVIYSLNESDYNKMPALYGLDDFDSCLLEPGGVYCLIDVELHAEPQNDLMRMIQGYSEYSMKHYNHTVIHRGVCATRTCKRFSKIDSTNTTLDLNATLEGCLNDSLYRNYGLQGRLVNIEYCKREGDREVTDTSDIVVAVVYILIIVLNVVGTSYDEFLCQDDEKKGNPYLLAFSIRRNWRKLVVPSAGFEPRLERLKLFQGLRSITMVCVFFSHTTLLMSYTYVNNPLYVETSYNDPFKQILFNGSLVTHTFFVMSSFLLAYNFQLHQEKHKVSWVQFPKGILLRWLRLTPVYALVLATIATLMRHAGHGPLWDFVVVTEAEACRQYWWAHVLYINNYIYDDVYCTPQTWYLAADTQMFCLGLLICVVARGSRARKVILSCLFLASLVISAAHTYFQDLDAVVIQSPEKYRNLYAYDSTFRLLYIRGHTNLSTYTLGLAGGFLTYHWQKEGKDFSKYRVQNHFKNYRWLFWLIFPAALGVILSGGLFYIDGNPPSTALRVLYATLYKPIFQTMVVIIIIGTIFKFESLYRSVVEWPGFTPIGRLSYSGFLLHTLIQRGLGGAQVMPIHMSDYYVLIVLAATTILSFSLAGVLWVAVESPANALTKAVLEGSPRQQNSKV